MMVLKHLWLGSGAVSEVGFLGEQQDSKKIETQRGC